MRLPQGRQDKGEGFHLFNRQDDQRRNEELRRRQARSTLHNKETHRTWIITKNRITVKLQNIVATGDIGQTIDIERLSVKLPNVIYEPEQFPGAIYHAKELEGASILVFASGKVVFAGLKRQELLEVGKRVLTDLAHIV